MTLAAAWLREGLQRGPVNSMIWLSAGFGGLQVVRFATNVALARLLDPSIFGLMLIFNTIRTGVELLSDIGIGQNVIANPEGDKPAFYNTAWTLQITRGLLMALATLAIAPVVGHFYQDQLFHDALPVLALIFVLSGFLSPGRFLFQKTGNLKGVAIFEFAAAAIGAVVQIAICYVYPNVWSLVYGSLAATVVTVVLSFVLTPAKHVGLSFERAHVREIFHFGKWLFFSTMLYYVSSNFDRLYLGKVIPFAALGIYGVARSLSEIGSLFAGRLSSLLVFPIIARNADDPEALRKRLIVYYRPLVLLTAIGLGGFAAVSDVVVRLLYDSRYWLAGSMLPIFVVGVWFSTLAMIGDGILLGLRRPAACLAANIAKTLWLLVALPLAFWRFGLMGAVVAGASADVPRYVPIAVFLARAKVPLFSIEIAASLALLAALVATRLVLHALGLSTGLEGLLVALKGPI